MIKIITKFEFFYHFFWIKLIVDPTLLTFYLALTYFIVVVIEKIEYKSLVLFLLFITFLFPLRIFFLFIFFFPKIPRTWFINPSMKIINKYTFFFFLFFCFLFFLFWFILLCKFFCLNLFNLFSLGGYLFNFYIEWFLYLYIDTYIDTVEL